MYTRILIATDGSDLAKRGLDHGLALAKTLKAKVFVLTVTEPWSRVGLEDLSAQTGGIDAAADYAATLEKQAREVLAVAGKQASEFGVDVEPLLLRDRHAGEGIRQLKGRPTASGIAFHHGEEATRRHKNVKRRERGNFS